LKSLFKNRLLFLVAFGFSKATVFFAPLLLSNQLTKLDYGLFEFALNIAFIAASIISLGVTSAYPYFKLKRNLKTIFVGFKVYYMYLFVSSLILLCIILLFHNTFELILSVLFMYTLSNQMMYSTIDKTNENIIKAVITDSMFYIVLLLAYVFMYFTQSSNISFVFYFSICYSIFYILLTLKNAVKLNQDTIKRYLKLVKYGKSVMISGCLILLVANSGRLLIEYIFNDKNLIAIFSFYFRMASFVLIIHQILSIIYFKKIYTFSLKKLDRFFSIFLILILSSVIITFFIVPRFGIHFFKLFETFETYKLSYSVLCFQMFFWIVLANNESVIYRENLATKMNYGFGALLILFILVSYFIKDAVSFYQTVLILYILVVLATAIQFFILYKYKKMFLKNTILISAFTFIISLISFIWL